MPGQAQYAAYPVQRSAYQVGRFTLDIDRKLLLTAEGTEVPLRPKSLAMLLLLVENAGRTLSNDAIMSSVWPGLFVTENNVTQCVHEIRHALGAGAQQILRTRPRHGYLIAADVVAIPTAEGSDIGAAAPDRRIAAPLHALRAVSASNEVAEGHGVVQLKAAPYPVHDSGLEHVLGRVVRPETLLNVIANRELQPPDRNIEVRMGCSRDKIEEDLSRVNISASGKDLRFDGAEAISPVRRGDSLGSPRH